MTIKEIIDILLTVALTSGFQEAQERYYEEKDASDTKTPKIYFYNSSIEYTNQLNLQGLKTFEIKSLIFINDCVNVSSFDFDVLIDNYIKNLRNYCVNYEFSRMIEQNNILLTRFERAGEKEGILYFSINQIN